MSNLATTNKAGVLESVLIQGDLSRLTSDQCVEYYNRVCESVGLNPLTRPFDYHTFQGRKVLYCNKSGAEQLRKIHGVSTYKIETAKHDDLYVVVAYVRDRSGREDSSTGATVISGLKGDALINAMLKAETKAKRRATLSICGLGMLDETEVESMGSTAGQEKAAEVNEKLALQSVQAPKEIEGPEIEELETEQRLADYVRKTGKAKGRKLSDLNDREITGFLKMYDAGPTQGGSFHADVHEDALAMRAYLVEKGGEV